MTPFERLIQFLVATRLSPWFFLKFLFLTAFLLYFAFAVIVVRQVKLMSQTVEGVIDWPLRLIVWIHLGVAAAVFWLALTTL